MDKFTQAYLECALWATCDNSTPSGGVPLDENYDISDITQEALKQAEQDCKDFQEANAAYLALAGNDEQNGHDFFLTRCGHGAGYWDRGYDSEVAKRLTAACNAYGEVNFYPGDDGKIYC